MSSPTLRVFLNKEEDRTLSELTRSPKINQRIKQRAHIIRLSSQGWRVKTWGSIF